MRSIMLGYRIGTIICITVFASIFTGVIHTDKMKKKTANDLRKAFEENGLTEENIREYLAPKPKKEKPVQFTVSMKRLAPYRDILPNQETLESLFIEFLDQLKSSMQQVP